MDIPSLELLSPRSNATPDRGAAHAAKAASKAEGIGSGDSSLEATGKPADEEVDQPVEHLRFCALLDCLLPQSVVIYLEELCMCVYSWVLTTFCRADGEPPQPVELHSQQKSEQIAQTPLLQAQQELLKGREGRRRPRDGGAGPVQEERRPYSGGAEQVQQEHPAYVKSVITQRAGNYFTANGVQYQFTDSQIVNGRWGDNDEISIAEDFRTQEDGSYFAENLANGSQTRITPVR